MRKRGCYLPRFRGLKKLLEVAIFAEDIRECLFDDIVCASADEGGVLIDLGCCGVSSAEWRALI